MEKATFGAGCFWGVEVAFRNVEGVLDTAVGYCGGRNDSPTYEQVCSGTTNHAEVVDVDFDPDKVSYDTLLNLFWSMHDPTTMNRQGPDVGTQYRSVVFVHSPEQREVAEASKKALDASGALPSPVVTQIVDAEPFWRGEEYHQCYLEKRGMASCHIKR